MRLEPRREQSAAPRASYRLSSGTANPPVSAWNPSPFFTSAGWAEKRRPAGGGALFHREQAAPASGSAVPIREDLFRRPKRAILPALEAQVPAPRFPPPGSREPRPGHHADGGAVGCPGVLVRRNRFPPFGAADGAGCPRFHRKGLSGASSPAYFQQNK